MEGKFGSVWFWIIYVIVAIIIWANTDSIIIGLIGSALIMLALYIIFVILAKLFG